MEVKLFDLLLTAKKFTQENEKYYIDLRYDSESTKLELSIRDKKTYEYIQTIEAYLDKDETSIDKIINYIETF